MSANLQSSKVAANELSSSAKFNNLVQAVEDYLNSIDNSNVAAAANILVSKLAAGSNGDVLTTSGGIPVWAPSAGAPGYSTSLPGSPTNGQEHILVDSTSAPTYAWRLRFNSSISGSFKWEFIGGRPGFHEITTGESRGNTSYGALTTPGPLFALPVAGDYQVEIGFTGESPDTNNASGYMSYDIGGTGAVNADAVRSWTNSFPGSLQSVARARIKTGLTAVTLTAKYRTDTSNRVTFADRWMRVTPVRL